MNFLSIKTRGMGENYKVGWVWRLKMRYPISFLAIQETQLMEAGNIDVRSCWGDDEFGVSRVNASGRPRGLLNMWDRNVFTSNEVISSRHYIINIGTWVGISEPLIFANIYGPQLITGKAELWKELIEIKNTKNGIWIMMGDYNAVRHRGERFNSNFCERTTRDFNNFIHKIRLSDLKMGGHRFTCFHNSDLKLSKLDRFMVYPTFLNLFPYISVTALPREISDHCPILLSTSRKDFGPSPFRFFNSWMLREGFKNTFISNWNNFVGYGTPDLYLTAKIKHIKNGLKK